MNSIVYKIGEPLDLDEVISLYRDSTFGERRPIENRPVMEGMIKNANLIITAWDGQKLIGISRVLTDFVFVAYIADLAVSLKYQHQGIGTKLISETKKALEPTCFVTLLSAPKANEFYPKIGFTHNPRAWMLDAPKDPKKLS